jgi:hypothetical protein
MHSYARYTFIIRVADVCNATDCARRYPLDIVEMAEFPSKLIWALFAP